MSAFLYCGTGALVDADRTRRLLQDRRAIWCPPMRLPQETPEAGDRIWLVWREHEGAEIRLLGGGRIAFSGRSQLLWNNVDAPGLRESAEELGYGGPRNMTFLVVASPPSLRADAPTVVLGGVVAELQPLGEIDAEQLAVLLPL